MRIRNPGANFILVRISKNEDVGGLTFSQLIKNADVGGLMFSQQCSTTGFLYPHKNLSNCYKEKQF
jgi:hypothetical protein